MPSEQPPDVWHMIFNQTPQVFRWLLGILSLGAFTVAGLIYRVRRDDLNAIHSRMDRIEERIERQYAENHRMLVEILTNTRND